MKQIDTPLATRVLVLDKHSPTRVATVLVKVVLAVGEEALTQTSCWREEAASAWALTTPPPRSDAHRVQTQDCRMAVQVRDRERHG